MSEFPADELASAYLDGEVTADERARVEGDPALLARVEELRGARDALTVAAVEHPSGAVRDTAIRAALDAAVVTAVVADLDGVRERRARARLALQLVSVAAAIVVVLVVAGAALIALSGSSGDKKSSTAAGAAASAAEAPTSVETPSVGRDAAGATAQSNGVIGPFDDDDALVAGVRAAIANEASKTADASEKFNGPGAPARCSVTPPSGSTDQMLGLSAVLAETMVQLDLFTLADGSSLLVVTDSAHCTTVFSRPL